MNKIKNFNQIAIAGILVLVIGKVAYAGIVEFFICPGDAEFAYTVCDISHVLNKPDKMACFCANH